MAASYGSIAALTIACFFMVEVTSAHHDHLIVKRSDDPSPLQAVVDQLTQNQAAMQARLTALENGDNLNKARLTALETANSKQVSFLAYSNAERVLANAAIPLSPALNIGNGFSSSQSVFIAPFPGVYLLTFQVFCHQTGDVLVDLMQNNNIVVRIRVFDAQYETSEASAVVVQAAAGDRFWLRPTVDATLFTGVHSFFSGALIAAH